MIHYATILSCIAKKMNILEQFANTIHSASAKYTFLRMQNPQVPRKCPKSASILMISMTIVSAVSAVNIFDNFFNHMPEEITNDILKELVHMAHKKGQGGRKG